MNQLHIRAAEAGGRGWIRVSGEADLPAVPAIESLLRPLLERGRSIVVDISGVSFCSYSFLSALDRLRVAALDNGGRLQVAGATQWLQDILRKIGMTEILTRQISGKCG